MKKNFKRVLAIAMCGIFLMTMMPTAFAAPEDYLITASEGTKNVSKLEKGFYNAVDKLICGIVSVINVFVPTPSGWEDLKDYEPKGFTEGMETFLKAPAENAKWSVGYDNASLLEGMDVMGKDYFVAGSLSVKDKNVTEIYDDLLVRTVALNDGSGRGTVVFSVIDGYGMSSTDVRAIRLEMEEYAKQNGINSINIGVLHQHSAIDTLGLNGSVLKALMNPIRDLMGKKPLNGQNEKYMRNLFDKTEQTIKNAVESMTEGKLYYSTVDAADYVRDKRAPFVLDTNINLLRFVPDNGAKETWMTTYSAHCVGNGAAQKEITGDYPYYMEEVINEKANANFMMMLGAEQGTTQKKDTVDATGETEPMADVKAYGKVLANLLIEKGEENAVEVKPLLNVAYKEMLFPINNPILTFAGKMGLVSNKVVKDGRKFKVVSEIGYMEMGEDLAFAFVPGELAAELAYGNMLDESTSWKNEKFEYPTMQEMVGERQLLILGILNDQAGYIIPDNDYMSILYPDNKSLELVSLGDKTASSFMEAFEALVESCKNK